MNGKSLKRERNQGKYGFMGFGLTFIAFQTAYFRIESSHNGKIASRTYHNLYRFVYGEAELGSSVEELENSEATKTTGPHGTVVTAIFPTSFPDPAIEQMLSKAFSYVLKTDAFVAILRTRSAVGLLDHVFGDFQPYRFTLKVAEVESDVNVGYLTAREIVKSLLKTERRIYHIDDEFKKLVDATEHLPEHQRDTARRCALLDQKLTDLHIGTNNPLKARLYVACTSKDNINNYNEQILKQTSGEDGGFRIENGLWLALDGMPTGICLDAFERAAYLPFSAIIDIQDTSVRKELDAGRKGISEYRVAQIREHVYEVLRGSGFIKHRRNVVGTDSRVGNPLYDPRRALEIKCEQKRRYNIDIVQPYLPPLEEQGVVSLFIELLARNVLKGYQQKVLSGYEVYDGLYSYQLTPNDETLLGEKNRLGISRQIFDNEGGELSKDLLIEFKTDFAKLYKDIAEDRKDISQINILVCWSTGPANADYYLNVYGDILQPKTDASNPFYGVTHQLVTTKRHQPLPIIELREVLRCAYNVTVP